MDNKYTHPKSWTEKVKLCLRSRKDIILKELLESVLKKIKKKKVFAFYNLWWVFPFEFWQFLFGHMHV